MFINFPISLCNNDLHQKSYEMKLYWRSYGTSRPKISRNWPKNEFCWKLIITTTNSSYQSYTKVLIRSNSCDLHQKTSRAELFWISYGDSKPLLSQQSQLHHPFNLFDAYHALNKLKTVSFALKSMPKRATLM